MTTKRGNGLSLSAVTFYLFAEALFTVLFDIKRKLENIMAQVSIDQAVLDADGQALTTVAADLQTLLAAGSLSPADQKTLQDGINAITALDTLVVTPPVPTS